VTVGLSICSAYSYTLSCGIWEQVDQPRVFVTVAMRESTSQPVAAKLDWWPRGYRPPAPAACNPTTSADAACCNHSHFSNHDLRLLQRIKNLSIQTFVPQLPVEAFTVAVLPRTSRFDVQRSRPHTSQPFAQLLATNSGPLSERI